MTLKANILLKLYTTLVHPHLVHCISQLGHHIRRRTSHLGVTSLEFYQELWHQRQKTGGYLR